MKRRTVLQLAAAMLAVQGEALAQSRRSRMAYLSGVSAAAAGPLQKVLFARFDELGYHEGRNLVVERRFAEGKLDLLPALAAPKATHTIPVVLAAVGDPVGMGCENNFHKRFRVALGFSCPSGSRPWQISPV